MSDDIYHFSALDIEGNNKSLIDYKGKVLIIVNTASKCRFTPQYEDLEKLYREYKGRGLEILGFPCDQFGHQEPGPEAHIKDFCKKNYGITFRLFSKIEVNGEGAHPLFKYLKKACPGLLGSTGIKWNFTKFIIDRNGVPVKRYAPMTIPGSVQFDIEELL
jgi:glutathione peroxidase